MNNNFEIVRDELSITINFANFSTVDSDCFIHDSEKAMIEANEAVQKQIQQVITQFDQTNGWATQTFQIVGSQNKTLFNIKNTFLNVSIDVNTTCDCYDGLSTATIEWDTPDEYLEEALVNQYIDQLYDHLEKEDIIWYCNDTANEIVSSYMLGTPVEDDDFWWDEIEKAGYYYDYVNYDWVPIDEASDDVKFRHKHKILDEKNDHPLKQFVLGKEVNAA